MRLTILYREHSDHARAVSEFVGTMRRCYPGKKIELLDIDTRAGASEAALHGVVQYPALIITSYEGRVMNQWEGDNLPTIDEVAGQLTG
jgi:hypothetical protein